MDAKKGVYLFTSVTSLGDASSHDDIPEVFQDNGNLVEHNKIAMRELLTRHVLLTGVP